MKRLFVAVRVEPDENFNRFYNDLTHALKHESIKWVEIYNIHITLKFLGETIDESIPAISNELTQIAAKFNGFNLNIADTGVFGSNYNPKLLWLGVESKDLKILGIDIINGMSKVGFIPDRQNFVPHITIGRIKKLADKKYFQKLIAENKEKFIQTIYVDKFHLIESVLHKTGPVYKILETYYLKKS